MLDLRTVQEDRERNRDREKANLQKCRDAKLWNLVCVRKNGYGRPAAVIIEILYDCSFLYGQDSFRTCLPA